MSDFDIDLDDLTLPVRRDPEEASLETGYVATDRSIRCPTCRSVLGIIWELNHETAGRYPFIAELATDRETFYVDAMWAMGPKRTPGSSFALPARVRCRNHHISVVKWNNAAHRWMVHPERP